jgi:hypothetical protein
MLSPRQGPAGKATSTGCTTTRRGEAREVGGGYGVVVGL